eukprot:3940916-Rhodomonas_salina.2
MYVEIGRLTRSLQSECRFHSDFVRRDQVQKKAGSVQIVLGIWGLAVEFAAERRVRFEKHL